MGLDFSDLIIERILRIASVDIAAGGGKQMTQRESMGIIIATKGSLTYSHLGHDYISDENHILIMPRGISYTFKSKDDSTSIVINFASKNEPAMDTIFSLEEDLKSFGKTLENLWVFEKPAYKLRCMENLYAFFAAHTSDNTTYIPSSKWAVLKPGLDFLEANITNPNLNNDEIASASGISTVYFRKLFTMKYHMPPMKYVRQKRIDKAKDLLTSQYYGSITDIAYSCGFGSLYHFSKAFKEETSVSPSEFIKLYRRQQ